MIICSLVLRFSALVSFFVLVLVLHVALVLLLIVLSCLLTRLFSCALFILSSCPFVSLSSTLAPCMGPALGATLHARLSCHLVLLFSRRKRRVGGYSPPLDVVTVFYYFVLGPRPTRLFYTDYLGHLDFLLRENVSWGLEAHHLTVFYCPIVPMFSCIRSLVHLYSGSQISCHLFMFPAFCICDFVLLSLVPCSFVFLVLSCSFLCSLVLRFSA